MNRFNSSEELYCKQRLFINNSLLIYSAAALFVIRGLNNSINEHSLLILFCRFMPNAKSISSIIQITQIIRFCFIPPHLLGICYLQ